VAITFLTSPTSFALIVCFGCLVGPPILTANERGKDAPPRVRLAVVLMLVLAFAEPYVDRFLVGAAPEKLQLVVVDNSFSMRAGTRLADAKRAALAFLSQRSRRDRAQVVARIQEPRV